MIIDYIVKLLIQKIRIYNIREVDDMGEKIEIKTDTEQRLLDDLKTAERENETLRSCLESVSKYEKERHEFELKCAKDIIERDKKAVANVILNMTFGKHYVSFC